MKFLEGNELTREMKRLVSSRQNMKIAIAYWGAHALTLLKLDPRRPNVRVLCCLKGGKSCPAVIAKFGERAKQSDKLHAKVIWTPTAAIVGSANASSNGLPEEEGMTDGLIEAGVFLDDEKELDGIERWFNRQYGSKSARAITEADLKAAKEARATRGGRTRQFGRELVEFPLEELQHCKFGVLLWSGHTTREEDRQVRRVDPRFAKMKGVDWYITDTANQARKYPNDGYYVLTYETSRDRRKPPKFTGLQHFPRQNLSDKVSSGYIVWALDVNPIAVPNLRPFTFGVKSRKQILSYLHERRMKLSVDTQDRDREGFVSWEPLHEFLGRRSK
jgi:hypothetical protein